MTTTVSPEDVHAKRVIDIIGKYAQISLESCPEDALLEDILSFLPYNDRARVFFSMKDEMGVHVSPFDRIADVASRLKKRAE